jgi:hypothetical protein
MSNSDKFIKQVTTPFLFRLFMLKELPMLFLAGVTVKELSNRHAVTRLKYSYLTKNPFRSVYFACLAMAAELSSGAIAMMLVKNSGAKISMLVTGMRVDYTKKAVGMILFTCNEGDKIAEAIATTKQTGEGVMITVNSIGKDEAGDIVASFVFTWSFRRK